VVRQVLVERGLALALDHGLRHQRELHAEAHLAELGDLGVRARLLRAELVGREANHRQALVGVSLVELLQAVVLRRQAALRGGVDQQHHLAAEVGQLAARAVVAGDFEIVKHS